MCHAAGPLTRADQRLTMRCLRVTPQGNPKAKGRGTAPFLDVGQAILKCPKNTRGKIILYAQKKYIYTRLYPRRVGLPLGYPKGNPSPRG